MPGVVGPDLCVTLRALKLGQMLDTLPDRLALARQQKMAHADFLQLILADEVSRREAKSASLRARAPGSLRDANAVPPLDMLDFRRAAFATPPELAQPLLAVDPSALACNVSGPGPIPPPGSVTPA